METKETIDLSPDWENVAKYLDQLAKEARQQGDHEMHKNLTELEDRCVNGGLPKSLAYKVCMGESVAVLTDEEVKAALHKT